MSLNKEKVASDIKAYRLYAATKEHNATPARTLTNATSREPYKGSSMASPRRDADAHFDHPSRGLTVQIERV